jgi:hypothetical protein
MFGNITSFRIFDSVNDVVGVYFPYSSTLKMVVYSESNLVERPYRADVTSSTPSLLEFVLRIFRVLYGSKVSGDCDCEAEVFHVPFSKCAP